MKTTLSQMSFESLIQTYDPVIQDVLLKLNDLCKKETQSVAKIFGRDIIGYGDITYSNSYVNDQPWFKVGLRVSKSGITLYLTAYNQRLYALADQLDITYGKGCYYMKKKDFHRLEDIQQLIHQSLIS